MDGSASSRCSDTWLARACKLQACAAAGCVTMQLQGVTDSMWLHEAREEA